MAGEGEALREAGARAPEDEGASASGSKRPRTEQ